MATRKVLKTLESTGEVLYDSSKIHLHILVTNPEPNTTNEFDQL